MTRTHVYYWSELDDNVSMLNTAIRALDRDLELRRPYMSSTAYSRASFRLAILRNAAILLTEVVPEAYHE